MHGCVEHAHGSACVRWVCMKQEFSCNLYIVPKAGNTEITNEDDLCTMDCKRKTDYRTTPWKEREGNEKRQLTGPEPATSRSIADTLAAEPWSLLASIDPFSS